MSTLKTNKLAHTANGAAVYTLPQTDGSAGQVLKTDGSGNLSWVTPEILQVVNTTTNGAASVTLTNPYANNNSYIYYITDLNTSLTTTQTNSKILISANIFGEATIDDRGTAFVISSSINSGTDTPIDSLRGPAYGDRSRVTRMMAVGHYNNDQDSSPSTTTFTNLLYAPAQASGTPITIKFGVVAISGNNNTFYLNRTVFDGNGNAYEKGSSSVTLMEVAP